MNVKNDSNGLATDTNGRIQLSVVIPIFNESESLLELHKRIRDVLEKMVSTNYEIILVDDGSNDGSLELLRELHNSDKHTKVIRFKRNFGQTAALAAGFDYANGSIIVTMDADLQNDPNDIPLLLQKIEEGYDIVSGWRRHRKDTFMTRKIPSWVANFLISKLTGVKLHDYGCTLKAYRRNVAKDINLYGELHRFIPALASLGGAKITEVAVKHYPRKYGKAKYGLSRTSRVVLDLLTVEFLLRFSTRPMQLFGIFGLFIGFVGFCIALYLTIAKVFYGISLSNRPLLLLAVLLIVVGMQFLAMGLIGELISRMYYESKSKKIYTIEDILA
jgi:glycosyltransferase involved in cell wall biosynthesis